MKYELNELSNNNYNDLDKLKYNLLKIRGVKNVNDYKIILMDGDIKNITVYANKNNIEKIKNNIKKEFIFDD